MSAASESGADESELENMVNPDQNVTSIYLNRFLYR